MSFDHMGAMSAMRSMRKRGTAIDRRLPKGTWRRVFRFAAPYKRQLLIFLVLIIGDALIMVVTPILAGRVINDITGNAAAGVVVRIAIVIAALAVVDAGLTFANRWYSARIGEGLI